MGFEPTTASLEGWNSTTELRPPISPMLRSAQYAIVCLSKPSTPKLNKPDVVGRQGFEPWKPMATDLQSAPFGHLGTCPNPPYIVKSKRLIIVFFIRVREKEEQAGPRTASPSLQIIRMQMGS